MQVRNFCIYKVYLVTIACELISFTRMLSALKHNVFVIVYYFVSFIAFISNEFCKIYYQFLSIIVDSYRSTIYVL